MKAVRIHRHGGPEVLALDELEPPEPGPGQARVRLLAAGVNYMDVYQRDGLYKVSLPLTLGNEGAGVVDAVAPGVSEVRVGDRVAYSSAQGAYAQYAVVPSWQLVSLPPAISFETGAAVMLQGLTAHYLTHSTFPIHRGQRVLIHAAAGGVGLLFIQIAKHLGATVYGTVGSRAKADLALAAGADAAIVYTEQDFAAEVRRLTGGAGVHAVFDSVGRDTFAGSLQCLAPRGMLVCFGQASGPVGDIDLLGLGRTGSYFFTRPVLAHHIANRADLSGRAQDLLGWVARGELQVRIDSVYPLDEAAEAHRRIESRASTGKILLRV